MRLYIAEQNALAIGGHYAAYTTCIAEGAVARGLDVSVLHNKRHRGEWPGTAVSAFTFTWGEAESRAPRGWQAGTLAHDFVSATRDAPPRAGDHVLFHTVGYAELIVLLGYFTRLTARHDLPFFHVLLRYDPGPMRDDIATFRPLFQRIAASAALRRHIRFHTDTAPLARAFERLSLLPFSILPIPFEQGSMRSLWPKTPLMPGEPITITYLGDARGEKGYGLLPQAFDALRRQRGKRRPLRFVVQSNFNTPGGEPGIGAARDALRAMPDVALILEPLDGPAYYERLVAADAIVIPYDAASYGARSSGILVEAMAAGKPVVTTAGSWMATQVSERHAVVYGADRSLGAALIELVDRYEALAAAAALLAPARQIAASGTTFIDHLTASVAQGSPRDRPPNGPRILVIMDGDAMVLRNGASRVALSQLAYLQAAGYRTCALFVTYRPEAVSDGIDRWLTALGDRIGAFDLEAVFVAAPSRLAADTAVHAPAAGPSIEADLDTHRRLDFSAGLLAHLRGHTMDAVLLNYVTAFPIIDALALTGVPVICEMHDVQSLQKGIYGRRAISPRDIAAELSVLARCSHLVSLNPDEAVFVQDHLPHVPMAVTGVFPAAARPVIESLAGCRDLLDVVTSCGPAVDGALVRESLRGFEKIDMLFVGSNHMPNMAGLRWFLDAVFLPDLAPRGHTLVVAGSVTDNGSWPQSPRILYLGRVDDLAPLYAAARVVLLPIFEGAGSPVKTVEALQQGKPVVATRLALRGIDAKTWRGIAIADDAPSTLRAIRDLLADASLRRQAGTATRTMAATLCDPARYTATMNTVFQTALGAMARPAPVAARPTVPEEQIVEWDATLAAVNTIVRDGLDGNPFDETLLKAVPESAAEALIGAVVRTLLVDQSAAILKTNAALLRQVVGPGVVERAEAIIARVRAARASDPLALG